MCSLRKLSYWTLGLVVTFSTATITSHAMPVSSGAFAISQIATSPFALEQPGGLAIASNGGIYVASNIGQILPDRPSPPHSDVLNISPNGAVTVAAQLGDFVGGLAHGPEGGVYGSLFDGSIFRIDGSTVTVLATGLPSTLEELVVDRAGNIFVVSFSARTLTEISPTGTRSTLVEGLGGPFGVALKGSNVLIGDNANGGNGPGVVLELSPTGMLQTLLGSIAGRIIDLEVDPVSGAIFFANQGSFFGSGGSPGVFKLEGSDIVPVAAGFDGYPREIEFDSQGNLYVNDDSSLYRLARVAAAPEPSTISLAILLLGVLALRASRQRH